MYELLKICLFIKNLRATGTYEYLSTIKNGIDFSCFFEEEEVVDKYENDFLNQAINVRKQKHFFDRNLFNLVLRVNPKNKLTKSLEIMAINFILLNRKFKFSPVRLFSRVFNEQTKLTTFFKIISTEIFLLKKIVYMEGFLPELCFRKCSFGIYKNVNDDIFKVDVSEIEFLQEFNIFIINYFNKYNKLVEKRLFDYLIHHKKAQQNKHFNTKRFILLNLIQLKHCKMFKKLRQFFRILDIWQIQNKISYNTQENNKKTHFILILILMKFKTITETIFYRTDDLFTKNYVPLYKIIVMKNLLFELHLLFYLVRRLNTKVQKDPSFLLLLQCMFDIFKEITTNNFVNNLNIYYELREIVKDKKNIKRYLFDKTRDYQVIIHKCRFLDVFLLSFKTNKNE